MVASTPLAVAPALSEQMITIADTDLSIISANPPSSSSSSSSSSASSPTHPQHNHHQPTVPPSFSRSTTLDVVPRNNRAAKVDGGKDAWLVVLGSFLIHCYCFAPTEYVFGIFELHYHDIFPRASASSIAFVGTTGSAVTYLFGFVSGIIADRFGFRITAFVGTVLMTVSLVLASFATELFGVGASLAYYPAVAAPSHWFVTKRGLATGLAVSGVGAGGSVLAPFTHWLIDRLDINWTLRSLALLGFIVCGSASCLISEHRDLPAYESLPQENSAGEEEQGMEMQSPDLEKSAKSAMSATEQARAKQMQEETSPGFFETMKVFKDPQFLALTMAELCASIGYLIPLYYMQTYAVFIGLSPQRGALILGLSNGASFTGRIALGIIADYLSNAKVLLFCSWMTAFAVTILWTFSKTFATFLSMALIYGFFA
ncbi:hypothetical protein BG004_008306, partial [Podila humilis]